jgi:hypothetical protein
MLELAHGLVIVLYDLRRDLDRNDVAGVLSAVELAEPHPDGPDLAGVEAFDVAAADEVFEGGPAGFDRA